MDSSHEAAFQQLLEPIAQRQTNSRPNPVAPMELIEQVVFTGAETEHSDGPWRMVASPGVCEADAREILAWGPTQETLVASGPEAIGLYFHGLPSGAFAIGRTTCAGRRLGPCGGWKAATQCLVVRPRSLARFANNPFALLSAAQGAGLLRAFEELPSRLDAFRLHGRTPVVDAVLLRQLCLDPGVEWMAALVQASLELPGAAIVGGPQAEHLVAGVMNCLPPECRTQISFSIGLRFSSRRPFRLVAMARDLEEQQRMARLYNVAVLDLSGHPPVESAPAGSWGRLVHRVLRSGRTSFFGGQLARRPLDFSPQDLPALGLQMLEELDASAFEEEPCAAEAVAGGGPPETCREIESAARQKEGDRGGPGGEGASDPAAASGDVRQAHAPHPPPFSEPGVPAPDTARASPPSHQLDATSPAVLEKLERLDDLVFEAISGNAASLEELKSFWPRVHSELGDPLLAESREQYLRYALASWEELAERDGVRDPSLAAQSLEVLCVLFGGA